MKIFLFVFCTALALQVDAQKVNSQKDNVQKAVRGVCNGSFGDPVISQDFGSGPNPGPALINMTTLKYTSNNCPQDGYYTIANSLTGAGNCHPETWNEVPADHTGNPNGYMMIINASFDPSLFFTQQANGLCPNTTYEFSAYVLNLIIASADSADFIEPNIVFSIETKYGIVLASDTTGNIPNSAYRKLVWKRCSVNFTTPGDVTDVVVKMTNLAPGGNGNDLVLDDITFRACGPIIQTGIGSIEGGSKAGICQGTTANYTLKANVIGDNNPVYQWQLNYNNSGWNDITGSAADTLLVPFINTSPPGTYQYRLGVANGSIITDVGCRVYSPPITIAVNPLPVVPPIADQTVCEGYPLQLIATGGSTYTWTGPGIAPTSQNPLIINSADVANMGTYTVVAVSDSGCMGAPVQTNVAVIPKVVATVSGDIAICAGETTQLSSAGGKYYQWVPSTGLDHDNIPNPVASPLQTTVYTVHVSNDGCTDSSKSVKVTVNQNPVADAGANKKIFEGQSVKLDGSVKGDNLTSYFWTPVTFLDNPQSLTPIATPTDNITYTLNLISLSCGTATSQVYIRVYKKITIPNTFSPNGDGVNDVWNIKELFTYPDCSLQVYNRYGQQIFQSIGYAAPWDGGYNSSPLPEGTYYYILDLKNGTPKISGWVLIVR